MEINDCIAHIPSALMDQSGSVFYSGRNAFSGHKPLYILGINPGGSIKNQAAETVAWHTNKVLNDMPADWSAYRDESWAGAVPGTFKMQPRVLHLFKQLGLAAGDVPASNLVFMRSSRENTLEGDIDQLANLCWPFHGFVINQLKPRVVLCLGRTPGNFVRGKLNSGSQIDKFVEQNNRGWTSRTYAAGPGQPTVVVVTNPSIANWINPVTDPSPLVQRALDDDFDKHAAPFRTVGTLLNNVQSVIREKESKHMSTTMKLKYSGKPYAPNTAHNTKSWQAILDCLAANDGGASRLKLIGSIKEAPAKYAMPSCT